MRSHVWVAATAIVVAACDGTGSADGARGPCAAGGQILGDCPEVETAEDACWKLVQCGAFPVENNPEAGYRDWGACVDWIDAMDADSAEVAIACVAASSCDQLIVNDSPATPYEWPDCLQFPEPG